MWTYGQGGRLAVTFIALTVLACGDDDSKTPGFEGPQPDASEPTPGIVRTGDGGVSMDGGAGMDASRPDAATGQQQQPGDAAAPDGATVVADADAAAHDMDAAATGTNSDGSANVSDADAATSSDAAVVRDARVSDGGCDVSDPRYGCGTELNSSWLRFASGLEIDRTYERAWSPIFDVATMAELVAKCDTLTLPGVAAGEFKVPAIADVRTLAGGCDNTVLTSDACKVQSGDVQLSSAGTCSCDPVGIGPNNGKFCRSDVPECVTLWTQTVCGVSLECPMPDVWLYDVANGAVVHTSEFGSSELRQSAKGRCFAGVAYPIP